MYRLCILLALFAWGCSKRVYVPYQSYDDFLAVVQEENSQEYNIELEDKKHCLNKYPEFIKHEWEDTASYWSCRANLMKLRSESDSNKEHMLESYQNLEAEFISKNLELRQKYNLIAPDMLQKQRSSSKSPISQSSNSQENSSGIFSIYDSYQELPQTQNQMSSIYDSFPSTPELTQQTQQMQSIYDTYQ